MSSSTRIHNLINQYSGLERHDPREDLTPQSFNFLVGMLEPTKVWLVLDDNYLDMFDYRYGRATQVSLNGYTGGRYLSLNTNKSIKKDTLDKLNPTDFFIKGGELSIALKSLLYRALEKKLNHIKSTQIITINHWANEYSSNGVGLRARFIYNLKNQTITKQYFNHKALAYSDVKNIPALLDMQKTAEVHFNSAGNLHNENGPALKIYDRGKIVLAETYINGVKTNLTPDNPAETVFNDNNKVETVVHYKDGRVHKDDGPAVVYYDPDGKIVCYRIVKNGVCFKTEVLVDHSSKLQHCHLNNTLSFNISPRSIVRPS